MARSVIIVLQPTSDNILYCHLVRGGRLFSKSISGTKLDQVLLPLIDKSLKQRRVRITDIAAIGLLQSPMSLASQRLVVSVVNSLGWAWNVPTFSFTGSVSLSSIEKAVQRAKKGFIKAEYSSKPRIGKIL